jgi:hypothetical protein
MATLTKKASSTLDATPPPPWDQTLYTRHDTFERSRTSELARRDANSAWGRFLSQRPLLYLPDRTPHGDCDARVTHGRQLWRHEELLAFDAVVAQRTQTLLQLQQAVLAHWQRAAMQIQANVRGLLARRRVQRMRQQLYEAAMAAVRAREFKELRLRQLRAAVRIQTVYHRHCSRLHYLFTCRQRVHRSVRLYIFRWRRQHAARMLQRAFRQFRRRVRLAAAMRALLRLLRRSRQRLELETAARAFHQARHARRALEHERAWTRHPLAMATATRVSGRKKRLLQTLVSQQHSRHGTSLPLLRPQQHGSHAAPLLQGQKCALPLLRRTEST